MPKGGVVEMWCNIVLYW